LYTTAAGSICCNAGLGALALQVFAGSSERTQHLTGRGRHDSFSPSLAESGRMVVQREWHRDHQEQRQPVRHHYQDSVAAAYD